MNSFILFFVLIVSDRAMATSVVPCWDSVSGGKLSSVVTMVEDQSFLSNADYIVFHVQCRNVRFSIKRAGQSELNLREIKKLVLLSYATKRKLQFTLPYDSNSLPASVDVDLSQPLTLQ